MDAPIWSNDLLYLKEMIAIFIITAVITVYCFRVSRKSDRQRALRMAHVKDAMTATPTADAPPDPQS